MKNNMDLLLANLKECFDSSKQDIKIIQENLHMLIEDYTQAHNANKYILTKLNELTEIVNDLQTYVTEAEKGDVFLHVIASINNENENSQMLVNENINKCLSIIQALDNEFSNNEVLNNDSGKQAHIKQFFSAIKRAFRSFADNLKALFTSRSSKSDELAIEGLSDHSVDEIDNGFDDSSDINTMPVEYEELPLNHTVRPNQNWTHYELGTTYDIEENRFEGGLKVHIPIKHDENYDLHAQIIRNFLLTEKVRSFKVVEQAQNLNLTNCKEVVVYLTHDKITEQWMDLLTRAEKLMMENNFSAHPDVPENDKLIEGSLYHLGYRYDNDLQGNYIKSNAIDRLKIIRKHLTELDKNPESRDELIELYGDAFMKLDWQDYNVCGYDDVLADKAIKYELDDINQAKIRR